jgi:hypothetical protein
MYGCWNTTTYIMDQSDIEYIIELLDDAMTEKDWYKVEEVKETLKEFLDPDDTTEDE